MDPRLEKSYVEGEMFRMIEAAAACIRHSAAKRPRMVQVVGMMNSPYTILNWFADFQAKVTDHQNCAESLLHLSYFICANMVLQRFLYLAIFHLKCNLQRKIQAPVADSNS